MTQPPQPQSGPLTKAVIMQIFGIIVVSSLAIAAVGYYVLEASFLVLLFVLLGLEFILAIFFIVYRTFVSRLS